MNALWRWIAGIGAAIATLLAALWGLTHWGRERERRQREFDRAVWREERRQQVAAAELERVRAETQAADEAAELAAAQAVESELSGGGGLAGWLNARTQRVQADE